MDPRGRLAFEGESRRRATAKNRRKKAQNARPHDLSDPCAISTRSKGPGSKSFPAEHLYQRLGLLRLEALTANLPWANA